MSLEADITGAGEGTGSAGPEAGLALRTTRGEGEGSRKCEGAGMS